MTPLHLMSTDSILALTNPSGRFGLPLFGTVKASNTAQMFSAWSSAVPATKSTCALPSGSGVVQNVRLSEMPASQE